MSHDDPDTLLARCRAVASRLPAPCEGSLGHLAQARVSDFEFDLECLREDTRSQYLRMEDGTYYTMDNLIDDMTNFLKLHRED